MILCSILHEENRLQSQSRERDFENKTFFQCSCVVMDVWSLAGLLHHSKECVNTTAVTHAQNTLAIRASGFSIEYDISKPLRKNCQLHSQWYELLIRCLQGTYESVTKINQAFSACCTVKTRVEFKSAHLNLRSSCQAHMGVYDL